MEVANEPCATQIDQDLVHYISLKDRNHFFLTRSKPSDMWNTFAARNSIDEIKGLMHVIWRTETLTEAHIRNSIMLLN